MEMDGEVSKTLQLGPSYYLLPTSNYNYTEIMNSIGRVA